MKKIAIIMSSTIIFLALALAGRIAYMLLNQNELGMSDKMENVNVMLERPDDWSKMVQDPTIMEGFSVEMIDGSTATLPITAELLRQFWNYTDSQINNGDVFHSTTHSAYVNLIDQLSKVDDERMFPVSLIFVTPPSGEENQYASNAGVTLDMAPIAKDGFVFITHKDNPVDSLTAEQIQDIYSGKINNWKKLGGEDLGIIAFQREPNSGSQTAMEQIVMQGKDMVDPVDTKLYSGMGMLVDAVAEYQNGKASIGYTYNYYINNLYKNDCIKVLKINGISPEKENLLNDSYPFTTNYYAVIRGDEDFNAPARKLWDFLLTEKGQQLVEMAGYCRSVSQDD